MFLLTLLPILMGAALATQTGINAKLRYFVQSPYLASGISFFIAFVFLVILALIQGQNLLVSTAFIQSHPYWIWLGGVLGMIFLTGNILLFTKLGSLQASVLPIMGQIIMGIIIDSFGLFHSQVNPLTLIRIVGLVLLVFGVLISLGVFLKADRPTGAENESSTQRLIYQIIGIVLGMCMAVQSAINGYLGKEIGSPVRASVYSFLIGTILLIIVLLIKRTSLKPIASAVKATKTYPWIWVGGLLGACYILFSAWLVPIIGTGATIVFALFGQLLFSSLIQHFGWLDSIAVSIDRSKVIGSVVMLIGIIFIRFL